MRQKDIELLEGFLAGELREVEQQSFADQLARDSALRAEVALHRQLGEAFADPGEVDLRATLRGIRAEGTGTTNPPTSAPGGSGLWAWWVGGILILGVMAWLLFPAPAPAPPPSMPELEAVIAQRPESPYDFSLTASRVVENGQTFLRVEGDLYANDLTADSSFLLQIYRADPDRFPDGPVYTTRFFPSEIKEEDVIAFGRKKYFGIGLNEAVPLPDQAYYFTVREAQNAPVLHAGQLLTE